MGTSWKCEFSGHENLSGEENVVPYVVRHCFYPQPVHLVKHHWWKNVPIFFMQLLEYLDWHLSPIGWKSSCRGESFLQSKVERVGEQSQSPMKGLYCNINRISEEKKSACQMVLWSLRLDTVIDTWLKCFLFISSEITPQSLSFSYCLFFWLCNAVFGCFSW